MTGMANGAVPAQFAVSGQQFKVGATRLVGDGFAQYGGIAAPKGSDPHDPKDPRNHAVATSSIDSASLYHLCQSVRMPGLPVSLVINAGDADGKPATASGLLIDMTDLKGTATFTNINIGQDASTLNSAGKPNGQAGLFGQRADHVEITDLQQTAWSTSAGTFVLTGLHLRLDVSTDPNTAPFECF
jgi:hypothetical protein